MTVNSSHTYTSRSSNKDGNIYPADQPEPNPNNHNPNDTAIPKIYLEQVVSSLEDILKGFSHEHCDICTQKIKKYVKDHETGNAFREDYWDKFLRAVVFFTMVLGGLIMFTLMIKVLRWVVRF